MFKDYETILNWQVNMYQINNHWDYFHTKGLWKDWAVDINTFHALPIKRFVTNPFICEIITYQNKFSISFTSWFMFCFKLPNSWIHYPTTPKHYLVYNDNMSIYKVIWILYSLDFFKNNRIVYISFYCEHWANEPWYSLSHR